MGAWYRLLALAVLQGTLVVVRALGRANRGDDGSVRWSDLIGQGLPIQTDEAPAARS